MTHLLIQTDKLEIISNEREFPVKEKYDSPVFGDEMKAFCLEDDIEEWKQTATRVTVHPGEEKHFIAEAYLIAGEPFESFLKQGIVIPECFEVREIKCCPDSGFVTTEKFAFFRPEEKATDTREKKGLRFSDPELQKRFDEIDPDFKSKMREKFLINEIEFLKKSQEWIKVSDRLPEENQYVLMYYPPHDLTAIAIFVRGLFVSHPYEKYSYTPESITHWLPLPEAPKDK